MQKSCLLDTLRNLQDQVAQDRLYEAEICVKTAGYRGNRLWRRHEQGILKMS
jgi:hypothetical protein